ncbi:hypothetical protein IPF37_01330 [bacterium]|nr:MAG: hypothetical protein IPF37_01330 [bacterium]
MKIVVVGACLLLNLAVSFQCGAVRRSLERQRIELSDKLHIAPEAQIKIKKSEQKDQVFLKEARKLKVSDEVLEELQSGDASLRLQRKRWVLYKQKEAARLELEHAQQALVMAQEHIKKLEEEQAEKQKEMAGRPHYSSAVQQAEVFADSFEECIFIWKKHAAYAQKRLEKAAEKFEKSELAYRVLFADYASSQKELLQRQYEEHREKGRVRWWHRMPLFGKRAREVAEVHRKLAQQMIEDRMDEKMVKIGR